MNLLVDANLSRKVVGWLAQAGHAATHVVDHGLLTAEDQTILDFAADRRLVLVSTDTNSAMRLVIARRGSPSAVLLCASEEHTPHEQAELLIANLPAVQEDLLAGAVVSIGNGRIRVRRLPM